MPVSSKWSFLSGFLTKFCMHFSAPIYAVYAPHLILLDLISLVVSAEKSANYEASHNAVPLPPSPSGTAMRKKNMSVNYRKSALRSFIWSHWNWTLNEGKLGLKFLWFSTIWQILEWYLK
jgi:hypothetical protein